MFPKSRIVTKSVLLGLGLFLVIILPSSASAANLTKQIASLTIPGTPWDLVLKGRYAYVAAFSGGLQIVDVSNRTAPTIVGSYAVPPDGALDVDVVGRYAYVSDQKPGLLILDVNNPKLPILMGSFSGETFGVSHYTVRVAGRYAYVGTYSGLGIVDISSPSLPTLVSSVPTGTGSDRRTFGIALKGRYAFVANADASVGLQVVDVGDPASPAIVSTTATAGAAIDVSASGNLLAVAEQGFLELFDVTTASSPKLLKQLALPGPGYDVVLKGRRAFVIVAYQAGATSGLRIFDVTDPASAYLLEAESGGNTYGVAARGNFAYVARTAALRIYDVSRVGTPAVNSAFVNNGVYKSGQGTSTRNIHPFPTSYAGSIFGRAVDFRHDRAVQWIFLPTERFDQGAIVVFNNKNLIKRTVKPFGGFSLYGFNATISRDPLTDRVFLAVGSKRSGTTVRVYEVTTSGLTLNSSLIVGSSTAKGNVLVQFLPLYDDQLGLATIVLGKSKTLTVWKFNETIGKWVKDKTYDLKKLKVLNGVISLR